MFWSVILLFFPPLLLTSLISSFILTSFCPPFLLQTHVFRSLFYNSFVLPHFPSFLYTGTLSLIKHALQFSSHHRRGGDSGGGGFMEVWGNWKYRTHISRWFPSYPRLSWLLRLFPHLHFLPCPPFSIHLLSFFSMLDPLSSMLFFIFSPSSSLFHLIPCLCLNLSFYSISLSSPFICLFDLPLLYHGATYIGLWLHTSTGDLCTGAWAMCIRAPRRTATHYGSLNI